MPTSQIPEQHTPEHTRTTNFDLAADALAREHEALANMQGSESRRVDGLVSDVGIIKGRVENLQGDMSRVVSGVEQLAKSMVDMNRHTIMLENHALETARLRTGFENHETRLQEVEQAMPERLGTRLHDVETAIPPLVETRLWAVRGILGAVGVVGLALLALVLKGSP